MRSGINQTNKQTNKLPECWLPVNQFGFRENHSTLDTVQLLHKIQIQRHKGNPVTILNLDLKKAFDKLSRPAILTGLIKLGLRGRLLGWISDLLNNREQCVRHNGGLSGWKRTESGVPQGAILSPLLFALTTIPLARLLTTMYVDDAQLVSESTSLSEQYKEIRILYYNKPQNKLFPSYYPPRLSL